MRTYKKLMLIILVAATAWPFWLSIRNWLVNPFQFSNVGFWLKPLIYLGLLAAFIGLLFLLVKNRWLQLVASVFAGLPSLFIFDFNNFYLAALILIIFLHVLAAVKIRKQATERIKIDIGEIMSHGLPSVITPILLLVSFAFFFSPGLQASAIRQELPPTVKEVISRVVTGLLGSKPEQLSPQERQQMDRLLVKRVIDQFNHLLGPYFKFLPPILAFGLFLILQGVSFIFIWLGTLIAMILFFFFRRIGLLKIKILQRDVEEIEFL